MKSIYDYVLTYVFTDIRYNKQYCPDWQTLRVLSPGKTFEVTFNKTGSNQYQCLLHPFMRGNVIVGVPDAASLESSTAGAPKANVTQGNEQIDEYLVRFTSYIADQTVYD